MSYSDFDFETDAEKNSDEKKSRGRPKGALSKHSYINVALKLRDEYPDFDLVKFLIDIARGDNAGFDDEKSKMSALKMLYDKAAYSKNPVFCEKVELTGTALNKVNQIIDALTQEELSIDSANIMLRAIETQSKLEEIEALVARITQIETQLNTNS